MRIRIAAVVMVALAFVGGSSLSINTDVPLHCPIPAAMKSLSVNDSTVRILARYGLAEFPQCIRPSHPSSRQIMCGEQN